MSNIRIISVVVITYFFLTASSCRRTPQCPTEANIFVGINADKPAPGKTVLICPGESIGLAWTTQSADTANINPELGNVANEGLEVVTPSETTEYTLTATGSQCSDEDVASVRVIKDEETIYLTLTEPPIDKETGVPVDLVWRGSVDPAFVSNSILVTQVEITTAGNWPTWSFRHTDTTTGQESFFDASLEQFASIATPFKLSGNYESTPTGVTVPVAIADFPVGLQLTLRCSQ